MKGAPHDHLIPPAGNRQRPSRPPLPSVDTLIKLLQQGHLDIDDLCAQLSCTPESLESALDSQQCADRLRLKTKLAQTALRLQVIKLVPKAVARLETLADSEKPEVARRATSTLLNLAGFSTLSPRATPWEDSAPGIPPGTPVVDEIVSKGLKLVAKCALNYPNGLTPEEINDILEEPRPDGSPAILDQFGPDDL